VLAEQFSGHLVYSEITLIFLCLLFNSALPEDQKKNVRCMKFFMYNGRAHMMYKEHEASQVWLPDFPGIDVIVGEGQSLTTAPAYAGPRTWADFEVSFRVSTSLQNILRVSD
jgi:hypothetical protein